MVKPFSVPFNIPKGSATADGYRIAPDFPTLGTTGVDANGNLISDSSYKNYGPGMGMTPFNTWPITPYPTTNANIVASTVVAGNRWLVLAGDNGATTLTPSNNVNIFPKGAVNAGGAAPNNSYVQFDWPRVPSVTVSGANLSGPTNVTFFGFDWYGKPLQHTYTVEVQGTYPGPIYNVAQMKGKAFYRITGVYFAGATPVGAQISCGASETFGLPYVLKSYADVSLFSFDGIDLKTQGGVAELALGIRVIETPIAQALVDARAVTLNIGNDFQAYGPQISLSHLEVSGTEGILSVGAVNASTQAVLGNFEISSSEAGDDSKVTWSIPNGGLYLMAPGDKTTPTAFTGDVRGLFTLPTTDGNKEALFSYYVQGFDEWRNTLNAGDQPQQNGIPVTGSNPIVPPNSVQDMYGLNQYYIGIPA